MRPSGPGPDGLRAAFAAFNNHDCSETASQVTPQGRRRHAKASGGKVAGFELMTDGIEFFVFDE